MKKKSKLLIAIFSILFIIIALNVGVVIYINTNLKPAKQFLNGELCNGKSTPCDVTGFVVDEGAYGMSTLEKLEDEGIIRNANIAYYYNRIFGGHTFYAGYYEIPNKQNNEPVDLDFIMGYIGDPNNALQDTVIIKLDEGDFIRSFAEDIASKVKLKDIESDDTYNKANALMNYWNSESNIRSYMNEYPFLTEDMFNSDCKNLLEGYLFPDTYEMFEYTSIDEVTRKILDGTLSIYEKYIDDFNNSKLSIHEIFTLASIVQWETGNADDSKIVAGSFLNRIDNPEFEGTGGKLQSTVTACYAFDLTKSECENVGDTTYYAEKYDPYNTYTIEGFPPGPVCCPNEVAISAALHPDQEAGYYFFVANMCEGGTAFARTYSQHLSNIEKYFVSCSH